ncbi:hypothetical protein GCM10027030_30470 [Luteococcus sediminum]
MSVNPYGDNDRLQAGVVEEGDQVDRERHGVDGQPATEDQRVVTGDRQQVQEDDVIIRETVRQDPARDDLARDDLARDDLARDDRPHQDRVEHTVVEREVVETEYVVEDGARDDDPRDRSGHHSEIDDVTADPSHRPAERRPGDETAFRLDQENGHDRVAEHTIEGRNPELSDDPQARDDQDGRDEAAPEFTN